MAHRNSFFQFFIFICSALVCFSSVWAQKQGLDEVELSHRVFRMAEGKFFSLSQDTEHGFLQLKWLPSIEEIAELESLGVKLQGYVGQQTYIASFQKDSYTSLQKLEIVRGTSPLLSEDKVEPYLLSKIASPPGWFFDEAGDLKVNIRFFEDIGFEEAKEGLEGFGVKVDRSNFGLGKVLNVSLSYWGEAELLDLAEIQGVRWVSAPSAPLGIQNQDAARMSRAENVSFPPYKLTGKGVNVGIWDGGEIFASHPDFETRVMIQDQAQTGVSFHATHVAGTIGGSGKNDPEGGARGMAPGVRLFSYDFDDADDEETSLEKLEAYLDEEYPVSIDNNSWAAVTGWQQGDVPGIFGLSFPGWRWYDNIESRGQYGGWSVNFDLLANKLPRVSIIKSAGNDRNDEHEGAHYHYDFDADALNDNKQRDVHPHDGTLIGRDYYDLLDPGSVAKNVITVGAVTERNSMAEFSNYGPTDDGRIKPDLVANGVDVRSTSPTVGTIDLAPLGCGREAYCESSGTSMSAPVVSGIAALFTEAYRNEFSRDPHSSEVKAALIQTAVDLDMGPGPSPRDGFGHVDAKGAVDLIQERDSLGRPAHQLQHRRLRQGEEHRYVLTVEDALKPVVVTMVWNDPAAEFLAARNLVNDLDVELIRLGKVNKHYPWRLGRMGDRFVALNNGKNRVDNVEKIEVPIGQVGPGVWMVTVRGERIATGAQDYAIAFSHPPMKEGVELEERYETCLRGPGVEDKDQDADMFDDRCEYNLAQAFRPVLRYYEGEQNDERQTFWAVQPLEEGVVRIFYALGYTSESGRDEGRLSYKGDPEYIVLDVEERSEGRWGVQRAALSKTPSLACRGEQEENAQAEWLDADKLEYVDGNLFGRPLIHVAPRHHSNYESAWSCHSNDCRLSRCKAVRGNDDELVRPFRSEEEVRVLLNRNLGNGTHPLNQTERLITRQGQEERFWDIGWQYCGFQVEEGGGRTKCAAVEESYGNSLRAFGFGTNTDECGRGSCPNGQWCNEGSGECVSCDLPNAPRGVECGGLLEFDSRIHHRLTSGFVHTCYLNPHGQVYCWGRNSFGVLGQNGYVDDQGDYINVFQVPLPVAEDEQVISISAGRRHTCALLNTGRIFCWGYNEYGQLGLGHNRDQGDHEGEIENLPYIDLGQDFRAVSVAGGGNASCAVNETGRLKCWGKYEYGRLGLEPVLQDDGVGDDLDEMGENLPFVNLGENQTVEMLSNGYAIHQCVLLESGCLKCWGRNVDGPLGYGDANHRGDEPGEMGDNLDCVDVGRGNITGLSSGSHATTCVVLDDYIIKCWGRNSQAQLGLGDMENRGDEPGEMGDNLPAIDVGEMIGDSPLHVVTQYYNGCAYNNSSVKCWGDQGFGVSGVPYDRDVPGINIGDEPGEMGENLPIIDLGDVPSIVEVSVGSRFACALFENERVKCWGTNLNWTLGNGGGNGDRISLGNDPGEMGDNLPYVHLPIPE